MQLLMQYVCLRSDAFMTGTMYVLSVRLICSCTFGYIFIC